LVNSSRVNVPGVRGSPVRKDQRYRARRSHSTNVSDIKVSRHRRLTQTNKFRFAYLFCGASHSKYAWAAFPVTNASQSSSADEVALIRCPNSRFADIAATQETNPREERSRPPLPLRP
jgi:hypothetical protein